MTSLSTFYIHISLVCVISQVQLPALFVLKTLILIKMFAMSILQIKQNLRSNIAKKYFIVALTSLLKLTSYFSIMLQKL